MSQQQELRLAGLGGQGIILAGIIMAEAAGIYDGKFVAQTQAYGCSSKGEASAVQISLSVMKRSTIQKPVNLTCCLQ